MPPFSPARCFRFDFRRCRRAMPSARKVPRGCCRSGGRTTRTGLFRQQAFAPLSHIYRRRFIATRASGPDALTLACATPLADGISSAASAIMIAAGQHYYTGMTPSLLDFTAAHAYWSARLACRIIITRSILISPAANGKAACCCHFDISLS